MKTNDIEIIVCLADDDRESEIPGWIAEIWHKGETVAEVYDSPQGLQIILYPRRNGDPWRWTYADLMLMLEKAKSVFKNYQ